MKTRTVMALVKKNLKGTTREPAALFLVILFPLLTTVAFGLAFGGMDSGGTSEFTIGVVNMDSGPYDSVWAESFVGNLTEVNGTIVTHYDDNTTGQDDLLNGNLDALVVIPEGFSESCDSYWQTPGDSGSWINSTVELYVDSGSMIAGGAIPPLVQQVLLNTLFGEQSMSLELPIEIGSPSSVVVSDMTQWDFMAPGMFAFAGVFLIMTVSQTLGVERETGLLGRMATTPVTSSEYMVSQTLSNMILALAQVAVIFTSSILIGYQPDTSLAGLVFAFGIVSLFALTSVGLGLITAVLSKSPDVATGIAFIFIMPQMFFGTFMPLGALSESIGKFMPSGYVTHALTTLFLRGAPITTFSVWMDLLILAVTGIVVLVVGIVLFKKRGIK
ncbi:MAG: ABC transporter permease [Candidatus Thorarchaeota archaeon]|nr:MAG: ABC transporter permease [Candidatus Thorarchaeota archaeon]